MGYFYPVCVRCPYAFFHKQVSYVGEYHTIFNWLARKNSLTSLFFFNEFVLMSKRKKRIKSYSAEEVFGKCDQ